MSLERKLEGLESELKLVKGEIKQTLIDLREHLAQRDAPFANLKVARLAAEAPEAPVVARPAGPRPGEPEARGIPAAPPAAPPDPYAQSAAQDLVGAHASPAGVPLYGQPMAQATGAASAWAPSAAAAAPPTAAAAPTAPAVPSAAAAVPTAAGAAAVPPHAPWRGAILALAARGRQPQAAPPPPPPEPAAPPAPAPAPAPAREPGQLDVHTVAGIIKWLAWTKDLLGPEGPDRLLELYNLTFPIPPQTQEMIRAAQALVPDPPQPPATASAEDSIALLLELHGILSGGGALMLFLHAMPQRGV